ncbi:MAG: tRNA uracil 4-sulfurtransferase ThiI, partial [Nanoarchaeota archaeon]
MDYVVVHYGEIALKKGRKGYFEQALANNIKKALKSESKEFVKRIYGRIIIKLNEKSDVEKIKEKLKTLPGISNFAVAYSCEQDIDVIKKKVEDVAKNQDKKIFMIRTKNSNKQFKYNSLQINEIVGEHIVKKLGFKVNLEKPDVAFYVEIVNKYCFIYTEKCDGVGGLPVGTAGKAVCLISGGIDSPAAAFMMMKRGCRAILVHFFNKTINSEASLQKIFDLVRILNKYQLYSKLYVVPFSEIQDEIIMKTKSEYRMIIYRRLMLMIAEEIAGKEEAGVLVTGENLAQVASQTMENLNAISKAVGMQIFRPLIG